MIRGTVNANLEAIFSVRLQLSDGKICKFDAMLDTGFTGFLTLPPDRISQWELPFCEASEFTLGDGSTIVLDVHLATMIWEGQDREVFVLSADCDSLAGMALLNGSRIELDVVDGGSLLINPIL